MDNQNQPESWQDNLINKSTRVKLQINSHYGKRNQFPGNQFQIDILTVVARLIDLKEAKSSRDYVVGRLIECDLPRLEEYLTSDVKKWSGLFDE